MTERTKTSIWLHHKAGVQIACAPVLFVRMFDFTAGNRHIHILYEG